MTKKTKSDPQKTKLLSPSTGNLGEIIETTQNQLTTDFVAINLLDVKATAVNPPTVKAIAT